jgi:uncharacterized membrane protein YphA (DoxX/SURF4 family)
MKVLSSNVWLNLVVSSLRFGLGLIFLTSGLAKLTHNHFPNTIGPPFLETELARYGLGLFAQFIAFSQVTIGFLLITKRFATLGAIMAMPLLLNIWVVVISLHWRGTPYVVGFLLLCNIILLLADFHKLKFIFTDDPAPLVAQQIVRRNWLLDGCHLVALLVLLLGAALWKASELMSTYLINLSLLACIGLGVYAIVNNWRQSQVRQREISA